MNKRTWTSILTDYPGVDSIDRYTKNKKFGINTKDKDGYTILHVAFRLKSEDCIKYILQQKVDIHVKSKDGMTALHYACLFGVYKYIKILLRMGANPNTRDKSGLTPLLCYCKYDSKDVVVVDLLLKYNANIGVVSNVGESALDLSILYESIYTSRVKVQQNMRFERQLCLRGVWFSRTERKKNQVRRLESLRRSLSNCTMAVFALRRALTIRVVHKDIIPNITRLVLATKENEDLWNK